jgi:hypothetical protein
VCFSMCSVVISGLRSGWFCGCVRVGFPVVSLDVLLRSLVRFLFLSSDVLLGSLACSVAGSMVVFRLVFHISLHALAGSNTRPT